MYNYKELRLETFVIQIIYATYVNNLLQGYRFRTVPAGTARIYRTGQQSGMLDPPVSYRKKYRPYRHHTGEIQPYRLYRKKSLLCFFFLVDFKV